MSDKTKFFISILFSLAGFLLGISIAIDFFYYADFPSIVKLAFGIVFIFFGPIAIHLNYKSTFHLKAITPKRKINWILFASINIGILLMIYLIIKGGDYDKVNEDKIIKNEAKESLTLTLADSPKEIKSKGRTIGYKIYDINNPTITFKVNQKLYNTNILKLIKGQKINVSILKRSYLKKIVNLDEQTPEILTLLSDRRVIHIIDIK